ncbi:MAG: alpha/beta hydrolase [Desulfobacterales bacterium]
MPYFKTKDGCRLFFETFSVETQNPAIVFLNGTTQTTVNWRPQALRFKKEYRILLYDARAQGKSEIGPSPLTLDIHVDDLLNLQMHIGLEKSLLVGLSHGAHVALAMAAKNPAQVDGLVLCSMAAEPSARAGAALQSWGRILYANGLEAMAWAALPTIFGEAYLAENRRILDKMVIAVATRNRADALIAHLDAMTRYPSPSLHGAHIRQPTLVISGEQDPLVSPDGAARLAALCRGTHRQLPQTGHTVPIEAPDLFNQALAAFFKAKV